MTDIWMGDDGYEYATTQGPRKAWSDQHVPPDDRPGWELDPTRGRPGESWDRFDFYEESYWRRRVDSPPPSNLETVPMPIRDPKAWTVEQLAAAADRYARLHVQPPVEKSQDIYGVVIPDMPTDTRLRGDFNDACRQVKRLMIDDERALIAYAVRLLTAKPVCFLCGSPNDSNGVCTRQGCGNNT